MSLLLGYIAGYYSLRFLQARVRSYAEAIVTEGRARTLGTFIRIGGIGLMIVLATRYPEKVHIPWLALGLGLAYIILFIDFTIQQVIADQKNQHQ